MRALASGVGAPRAAAAPPPGGGAMLGGGTRATEALGGRGCASPSRNQPPASEQPPETSHMPRWSEAPASLDLSSSLEKCRIRCARLLVLRLWGGIPVGEKLSLARGPRVIDQTPRDRPRRPRLSHHAALSVGLARYSPSCLAAHDGRELTSTRHVSPNYRWQAAPVIASLRRAPTPPSDRSGRADRRRWTPGSSDRRGPLRSASAARARARYAARQDPAAPARAPRPSS